MQSLDSSLAVPEMGYKVPAAVGARLLSDSSDVQLMFSWRKHTSSEFSYLLMKCCCYVGHSLFSCALRMYDD